MAVPVPQEMAVNLYALFGAASSANTTVCNYILSSDASFGLVSHVALPADAADYAVDLGELFPGITEFKGIFIREVTALGLGYSVSSNATGTRTAVRPSGIWVVTTDDIAPPTLYFDGAVGEIVQLLIGVFGS